MTDVNEAPEVADQSFGLDENLAAGTVVGTVAASDPDDPATPFGTLSYAITAGNAAGLFAIDDLTGEITTTAALDHEAAASHGLTVAVTDGGTPGLSDTALITIDVNDVNEAPEVADQSFGLDENLAAGTVVGTVAASDPDDPATPFGTLSYAITAGNAAGLFAIDDLTGEITTTAALDHEAVASHGLTVAVTDGGTPGLSDTAIVTVTVNPVADAPQLDLDFGTAGDQLTGTASGDVETAIALDVFAALTDTDGSETLAVVVSAILVGATLSDGTNSFTASSGNTSVDVGSWNLQALTITPPAGSNPGFTLMVTATSTETSNGDTESTTGTIAVTVNPAADVADLPILDLDSAMEGDQLTGTASGSEDTAIALDIIAALTDTDGSETLSITHFRGAGRGRPVGRDEHRWWCLDADARAACRADRSAVLEQRRGLHANSHGDGDRDSGR